MHSADYAVARCLSVRPSVRHTPVLCLNGYTSPQFFLPSSSPTILVFPHKTGGSVEYKGGMKNHDFRPIYHFISQMMQDRTIVTMEGE